MAADGIELRLPGERSVVVGPGFDRRTLLDLLHVLEAGAYQRRRTGSGVNGMKRLKNHPKSFYSKDL